MDESTKDPGKFEHALAKAYQELRKKAAELKRRGASLRLLSSLMGTSNYTTIYKAVLEFSDDMRGCGKARPSLVDQDRISRFEKAFPEVAREMKNRQITPRRWCSYHGFMKEDSGADVSVLTARNIRKMYTINGKEKQPLAELQEDFPEAFGIKPAKYGDYLWETGYPKYSFAHIDPSLYWTAWQRGSKTGKFHKICSNEELGVFVISYSMPKSKSLFSKIITMKINTRRIEILLQNILTEGFSFEGLERALKWLPATTEGLRREKKESLEKEARFLELDAEEGVLDSEYKEIVNRLWVKNEDEARKAYILNRIREIKVEKKVLAKEWMDKKKGANKALGR